MIQITKFEADALRKRFPTLPIHRTVSKYYVEDSFKVTNYLRQLTQRGVSR